jgi:hypothetical protein
MRPILPKHMHLCTLTHGGYNMDVLRKDILDKR